MKCGVIYLKIIPTSENLEWIKYCHLFSFLPKSMQDAIESTISRFNDKYKEDIIVPLYLDTHPGCIVKSEKVEIIAKDLYDIYNKAIFKFTDEKCIRCVYSIGDVTDPKSNVSIHQTYGEVLIRVGRYLDSSNKIGLFNI
jgi:hypothetical protein